MSDDRFRRRWRTGPPSGIALHADDGGAGDGIPIVFLHSLAGNARQWEAQLAHLRPTRRAVALEWRGHGRSPAAPDGGWRVEDMAEDVAAAADRLGLKRFVLVGHSAGGAVAIAVAGAHPERVAGLFLLDAAGDSRSFPRETLDPFLAALETDAYASTIEGYWETIAGPDPAVRERLMADLRATAPAAVAGVFRSTTEFDPGASLRRYPGPRLSVVTPRNTGPHSLLALDPSMPHVTATGTGHWIQLDRPDEMNRLLDDFLHTVESR
ncbi:MAG: alpha/beta fold hydrolase [Longimicrobiaceae bacterium]